MPKKFGTNSKAEEARERKAVVKKTETERKVKAAEDARWVDEGQSASEKRQAEKEAKRAEEAAKKAAKRLIQQREEEEMKSVKTLKERHVRVTLAQIESQKQAETLARAKEEEAAENAKRRIIAPVELTPNSNKASSDTLSASTIDDSIAVLSAATGALAVDDKHPERRMKAAFREYEKQQLAALKADNPTLKFSQLKDLLWRNWQKAPENPINAAATSAAIKQRFGTAERPHDSDDDKEDD